MPGGAGGLWELLEETGLTGGGGGGGGGGGTGTAVDLGTWDIRPYMRQAGGQLILIPAGNYYAGKLPPLAGSAYEHPVNAALPFNGKLRIGVQGGGRANLYCDPTGGGAASFADADKGGALGWGWESYTSGYGNGELGISFEDFSFINGRTVFGGATGIDFINPIWTNPPNVWKANFDIVCAAMGVPVVSTIPNTDQYRAVFDDDRWKGNGTPSGLRLQNGNGGNPCRRIRVINGDAHDTYDDPVFLGSARHVASRGYRCWNIGEVTYYGAGPRAWIHPDGIQFIGAEDDIDFQWNEILAHLEIFAEAPGNITRLNLTRTRNLMAATASIGAQAFRNLSGLIDYFTWGAINYAATNGDYEFAEDHPWYPMPDTSDYVAISLAYTWPADGNHMKHLTAAALAALGYTMTGNGRGLANVTQAVNDASNYANQWRAANPTNTEAGKQAAIDAMGGWAWNPA